MTEAEWLTTKLPLYMLREYPGKRNERKALLASLQCLCHSKHLLTDLQRRYVEAVASVVEEKGTAEEPNRLGNELHSEACQGEFPYFIASPGGRMSAYYNYHAVRSFFCAPHDCMINVFRDLAHSAGYRGSETEEKEWQCRLLREIFGNPFRPVTADLSWLTSDVLLLAHGIHEESAFDLMPILADALQDAGCDNVHILDHCREPGEHVRGCWVVDLLLRKG